jgi:hypothetical protein
MYIFKAQTTTIVSYMYAFHRPYHDEKVNCGPGRLARDSQARYPPTGTGTALASEKPCKMIDLLFSPLLGLIH